MKRIAVLLLALSLLLMPAAAEDLPQYVTDFVTAYNSYANAFAVQPLPFEGWQNNGVNYELSIGETSISLDDTAGRCFAIIVIPPQDANMDFLAVCACLSAAVRGDSTDNYADILTTYFLLRNTAPGEKARYKSSGGLMYFVYDEDLFLFGVSN